MESVIEPETKSEEEGGTESSGDGGRGGSSAEDVAGKLDSQRVEQLSRFLRHQQEVVYK